MADEAKDYGPYGDDEGYGGEGDMGMGGEGGGDAGEEGGHWGYGGDDYVDGDHGAYGDEGEEEEDPDAYDPEGDLPMFANKANKELDVEIRAGEKRLAEVVKHTAEHEERVRIMEEHLKNVQQELAHTQQLVDAKNKEISSEDHLKQLAEREAGRLRLALKNVEIRAEEVQDEMNITQNNIFKGNERLDRFKLQMNWNQEELEQWALAAKQKEEDNLALQKYTRADEARIKELTLQIEKVTQQVAARKKELEDEVTETQARQIELDRTAEEFRQLHKERQLLVQQWAESIEAMRKRDQEIAEAGEKYAALKEEIEGKQEILADHVDRLKQQQDDNSDVTSNISMQERVVAKMREQFQDAGLKLTEFQDEVEVLKNELQKAASDLMQKRSENTTLAGELESTKEKLENARKRYAQVKRQLETAMRGTDDVEAVAQQREDELKDREGALSLAERDLRTLKENMFKQSQELFRLRQEESGLIAEISGAQAASKNLSSKIHKLDQQSLNQQELVYNAEFQIQQLERRVARASGERSDAERKVLNARIEALQADLKGEKETESMLQEQVKRVEEDFAGMQRKERSLIKDLEAARSKMDELVLQNDSAESLLRSNVKEKEDVMVQHDVLKLEVKKLREALSARADDVYGLSNRKFQLEMSMEERKKEIHVHRDVQRAQIKVSEEERHKVAMELQDRRQKVEKLKAKFDTLAKATTAGDDSEDDGEEHTQAYYVIKAAQKREQLQREGDELDGLIRKAEREIRALENTLKHLNVRNTEFRASFHKADMSSREASQARNLEEQVKTAKDALFRKKKELQRMQTDLEEDKRRVAQLDDQITQMESHISHLAAAREQVEEEEAAQRDQIARAAAKVEALSREHRTAAGAGEDEETIDEHAFLAQAVRDTNNNVLFTLGQLAREFPELQGSLAGSVQRFGLKMPSRPPSRAVTADVRAAAMSADGSRPMA